MPTNAKPRRLPRRAATPTPDYDRRRDLPRLLPLTARQLARGFLDSDRAVMALLRSALKRESQRGARGWWSYDVARHRLLLAAYGREHERWQRRDEQRYQR